MKSFWFEQDTSWIDDEDEFAHKMDALKIQPMESGGRIDSLAPSALDAIRNPEAPPEAIPAIPAENFVITVTTAPAPSVVELAWRPPSSSATPMPI